jgi:hypothetical protein
MFWSSPEMSMGTVFLDVIMRTSALHHAFLPVAKICKNTCFNIPPVQDVDGLFQRKWFN